MVLGAHNSCAVNRQNRGRATTVSDPLLTASAWFTNLRASAFASFLRHFLLFIDVLLRLSLSNITPWISVRFVEFWTVFEIRPVKKLGALISLHGHGLHMHSCNGQEECSWEKMFRTRKNYFSECWDAKFGGGAVIGRTAWTLLSGPNHRSRDMSHVIRHSYHVSWQKEQLHFEIWKHTEDTKQLFTADVGSLYIIPNLLGSWV